MNIMITQQQQYLPLHLPLEVVLNLPLGEEYHLFREERSTTSCVCLVLTCVSGTVRFVFKQAIRACL